MITDSSCDLNTASLKSSIVRWPFEIFMSWMADLTKKELIQRTCSISWSFKGFLSAMVIFLMTSNVMAEEPGLNGNSIVIRGLSLNQTLGELEAALPEGYQFRWYGMSLFMPPFILGSDTVSWIKGGCTVSVSVTGEDEQFNSNLQALRDADNRAASHHLQGFIKNMRPSLIDLPPCFFDAPGMRPKDFAQQVLNGLPFVNGRLTAGANVGMADCECWVGLLKTEELIRINTETGTLGISRVTAAQRNKILPPSVKF